MSKIIINTVEGSVYPSTESTISVEHDNKYNGAHYYYVKCMERLDGDSIIYGDSEACIPFVKECDGTWEEGVQDEQLALIMLDRTQKLNKVHPSKWNATKIRALKIFLDACKFHVKETQINNR